MPHPATRNSRQADAPEADRHTPSFFDTLWRKVFHRLSDKLASIGVSFVLLLSIQFFNVVKGWNIDPDLVTLKPETTGIFIGGIWVAVALIVFFIQPQKGPIYLRAAYTLVIASGVAILSSLYLDARTLINSFQTVCEERAFTTSADELPSDSSDPCAALATMTRPHETSAEAPALISRSWNKG